MGPISGPTTRRPARPIPGHMPPNFYYDQEDFLRELSPRSRWSWSALRPRTIYGYAVNSPMNMTSVLGVYAAISKELGLPLRFPGTPGGYRALQQAIDTELLAKAAACIATEPRCANEVFNVTNGGSSDGNICGPASRIFSLWNVGQSKPFALPRSWLIRVRSGTPW